MLKLALTGICVLLLIACGGGEGTRGPDTESEAAMAHFREGEELFSEGQMGASIAAFSKAIRADPEFSDAFFERGLAWLATKRWNDAIDDYDEALALDPERVPAYYNRGVCIFPASKATGRGVGLHGSGEAGPGERGGIC